MDSTHAVKRVVAWGNSYGIRLTKAELASLGIVPGSEVEVKIKPTRKNIDWSKVATLDLGGDASIRHDEILYEGYLWEENRKAKEAGKRKKKVGRGR